LRPDSPIGKATPSGIREVEQPYIGVIPYLVGMILKAANSFACDSMGRLNV
jgi:hypothetical protein